MHKNKLAPRGRSPRIQLGELMALPQIPSGMDGAWRGIAAPPQDLAATSQESHPALDPADLDMRSAGLACPLPMSPPLLVVRLRLCRPTGCIV